MLTIENPGTLIEAVGAALIPSPFLVVGVVIVIVGWIVCISVENSGNPRWRLLGRYAVVFGFVGGIGAIFGLIQWFGGYYEARADHATVVSEWLDESYGIEVTQGEAIHLNEGSTLVVKINSEYQEIELVNGADGTILVKIVDSDIRGSDN